MYTSFFGLADKPFSITPDPRYLYMSERHAEALAHLLYGINEAGGFIQLTGEVGTGKTTVVRTLLEQLPGHADVAVILNPRLTPIEFLLAICQELGIFVRDEDEGSVKELVDILNTRLLAAHAKGRRAVVIVDEAQNLEPGTLEQMRLLTNLETATQKLLQIILIGQPELRTLLAREDLRQLAQRVTGRYHLDPLSREETAAYVKHRLKVAGATSEIFTPAALKEIHVHSRGIPRLINVICDRALLGGFTEEQHRIGPRLVRRAAEEVHGRSARTLPRAAWIGAAAAIVAVSAFAVWRLMQPPQVTDGVAESVQPPAIEGPLPVEPATPEVAAESAPAAPSAPLQDLSALLGTGSTGDVPGNPETTTARAFAGLFELWGGTYDPAVGPACDQAQAQGLACVFQKGSWAQLRMLNRPAILTLTDDAGGQHQVLVTGLGNDTVQLRIGAATHEATLAAVSRYWFGDYLLMWRPHSTPQQALSLGMQGEAVRWLRQSLGMAQGQPAAEPASDFFDEELAARVEEFQRRHRLGVDGVAGLQTQIVLDTLTRSGTPVLAPVGS